jgi:hypothetical protein
VLLAHLSIFLLSTKGQGSRGRATSGG